MKNTKPSTSVLLIDDEPALVDGLRRKLRNEPYEVFVAHTPAAALELLNSVEIDVVVSDYMMPGVNGLEILSFVKDTRPSTLRVLMTGKADLQCTISAINDCGIFRLIEKPFTPVTLACAIRDALHAKQQSRNPNVQQRKDIILAALEMECPGIAHVARTAGGAVALEDEDASVDDTFCLVTCFTGEDSLE